MTPILSTRRGFASKFVSLLAGTGFASMFADSTRAAGPVPSGVPKTHYEGQPAATVFTTPLIIHNGVMYIAGQGAHSHDPDGKFPTDIETHTQKVMENVKTL